MMGPVVRDKAYRKWNKAVARTHDWIDDDDQVYDSLEQRQPGETSAGV